MSETKKLIVSHAPFWHNGSSITERNRHTIYAALPAVVVGVSQYGLSAIGVLGLSVSSAIFWEYLMNRLMKRAHTIGDGSALLIGLLFAMLLPATTSWWAVIIGTFLAVVIGKHIFGGIGANPFNPVALSVAILMVSWSYLFDFNAALADYDFNYNMFYPLTIAKSMGADQAADYAITDLLLGRQAGGIGAACGLALIAGGIYLMIRRFIRWEISLSFIAGILITAALFHLANADKYAHPLFHLLTGYTLVAAFFLVPEDSSSPVNFIPMLIYGFLGGVMTMLIRSIGDYVDGVVMAILVINLLNPLLDKIRPKALGKVV